MVDEPKPKKAGRRRVKNLNTPLSIKEKKARKSAQDVLREKKEALEKDRTKILSDFVFPFSNKQTTKLKRRRCNQMTHRVEQGVSGNPLLIA